MNKTLPAPLLLPRPHRLSLTAGVFRLPAAPLLSLGSAGNPLAPLIAREWPARARADLAIQADAGAGFTFTLGQPPRLAATRAPQSFALAITPAGLRAAAADYHGLLYAWQALKQLIRQYGVNLPALRIRDRPDIPLRAYHLDLKGTRRTFENLLAILPDLAELRINAVIAEYEDFIQLPSRPDIAIPGALTPGQVRAFVRAAAGFGITVIPLVQTLGHLQYLLARPAYAHLREKPDDPSEACSAHPETWPLIRGFLDDIIALHPGVPYLHIGLDETFHIATCPRCKKALRGKPPVSRFLAWTRQVADHVRARGLTPIMWSDILAKNLDPAVLRALPRDVIYCDWGYTETGPLHHSLRRYRHGLVSREWFRRPLGRFDTLPAVPPADGRFLEDLSPAEHKILDPYTRNRHYPLWINSDFLQRLYRRHGLRHGVVSGIRVSFHGPFHPRFTTGQLNTLHAARACKNNGGTLVIGSSWSRGHSLAAGNAHPELDWYGIATLGAAGWSNLADADLRDFDTRFAFHFFGLPDGEIGDLLYLAERTSPRADHVFVNHLPDVLARLRARRPAVTRHADRYDLLLAVLEARALQFRMQFALLEMEYFYPRWPLVPAAMRTRIRRDIRTLARDARKSKPALARRYAHTLLARDAAELAATQLDFTRDAMLAMAAKLDTRSAR